MKNIVMAVASVALAITLVGCGEKTTEEKIGDGLTKDLTSAKSAATDAAKASLIIEHFMFCFSLLGLTCCFFTP